MSATWFQSEAEPAPAAASGSSWLGGVTGDDSGGLTYRQRLTMFVGLFATACVFFFLASFSIIMPVKFAKLFFLGSFFLISSLAFLVGPLALVTSAFSRERILSTASYLSSAALTMASAIYMNSSLLTMVALGVQFVCAAWLALSYLPFGQSFLGMAARQVLPL